MGGMSGTRILGLMVGLTLLPQSLPLVANPVAPSYEAVAVWSADGHMVVCDIAWRELRPPARKAVTALLALDPDYARFGPSCVWADRMRAAGRFPEYTSAHYVNIPRGARGYDAKRDCGERLCVVEAIEIMASRLRDPELTPGARLRALKFLGHFVGDVHQPLHAGYGDDRGGNTVAACVPGDRHTNLHQVWDRFIVSRLMDGLDWRAYGKRLEARITPADRRAWASLDPRDWANESFEIVETEAYAGSGEGCFTDAYAAAHRPTVERRLEQAGFRLGALLNDIFGSE